MPKGVEGEVVADIHLHPSGDALAEYFSQNTIANGGKGDEYIMTNIDEIDYYLLTPLGKLIERTKGGTDAFIGQFNMETGDFTRGGALIVNGITDNDLLPIAPNPDDPLKQGSITLPWDNDKLPKDLQPKQKSDIDKPKCIGCYDKPPPWFKPTAQDNN